MLRIRKSQDRGFADYGWLKTYHSFSFADYYDPHNMGYRLLRVLNQDYIAPGRGFPMHPHRDMEIITVIMEGALQHKDSLGNTATIRPDEVQRMTAGTGILHSEFNPSPTDRTHLLQIWILPNQRGLKPSYEQKQFPRSARLGRLMKVASPDGADGSVRINQDVALHWATLVPAQQVSFTVLPRRAAFAHVALGQVRLEGVGDLAGGDAVTAESGDVLTLTAIEPSEVLLFDLN